MAVATDHQAVGRHTAVADAQRALPTGAAALGEGHLQAVGGVAEGHGTVPVEYLLHAHAGGGGGGADQVEGHSLGALAYDAQPDRGLTLDRVAVVAQLDAEAVGEHVHARVAADLVGGDRRLQRQRRAQRDRCQPSCTQGCHSFPPARRSKAGRSSSGMRRTRPASSIQTCSVLPLASSAPSRTTS